MDLDSQKHLDSSTTEADLDAWMAVYESGKMAQHYEACIRQQRAALRANAAPSPDLPAQAPRVYDNATAVHAVPLPGDQP